MTWKPISGRQRFYHDTFDDLPGNLVIKRITLHTIELTHGLVSLIQLIHLSNNALSNNYLIKKNLSSFNLNL